MPQIDNVPARQSLQPIVSKFTMGFRAFRHETGKVATKSDYNSMESHPNFKVVPAFYLNFEQVKSGPAKAECGYGAHSDLWRARVQVSQQMQ